jgi:hypothetical protein
MILAGQALFIILLVVVFGCVVRAAFRRDGLLGWLVCAAAVTYVTGALLIGIYLQVVRGRNYLAPDEVAYQQEGALIVEGWKTGVPHVPVIAGGYPYWNAAVILLWGGSPLPLRLANAVAGTAGVLFAFVLAHQIFKDRFTARLGAAFVAVSPSLMIWGAQNLKERPLGVLVMMSLVAAVTLAQFWSWRRLALFAASLVLLGELRHYYAAMIGWIAIAVAGAAAWPDAQWRNRAIRLAALIGAVGFALQLVTGTFLASGMRHETIMRYVRMSDSVALPTNAAGLGYRMGETGGRPERVQPQPAGAWVRNGWFVLFGRFEPVAGAGPVMAVVMAFEWLLSFLLVPLVVYSVWDGLRNGHHLILIPAGFVTAMVLLLTYTHGDPWSTIRFRAVYWPVFLILASGGIAAFLRARQSTLHVGQPDQLTEYAD